MTNHRWKPHSIVLQLLFCDLQMLWYLLLISSSYCDPSTSTVIPTTTNNNQSSLQNSNCSMDFVMTHCKPFKTFQTCRNGTCVCPVNFPVPSLLKHNLTIDTYWEPKYQRCVSLLGSVCFYLPPSLRVSQPYRCVIPNSHCVQAPDQFRGIGICECNPGLFPASSGRRCINNNNKISNKNFTVTLDDSEDQSESNSYDPLGQVNCRWKYECPHVQECFHGECSCPSSSKGHKRDRHYYANMVWDDEEKVCLSLPGSYCNNARFDNNNKKSQHKDNPLMQNILQSMMEIRCVKGLTCEESTSFEIGVCSGSNWRVVVVVGQLFYLTFAILLGCLFQF